MKPPIVSVIVNDSNRPTLFDTPLLRHMTIREQFEAFHAENPHVLTALERMAGELVARGRRRISTKMLIEVLRYDFYISTSDPNSVFQINNNYSAYYARLMLQRHPEWDGLFVLREVHEESAFLIRKR